MQADELEETKQREIMSETLYVINDTEREGDNFKCENFLSFM